MTASRSDEFVLQDVPLAPVVRVDFIADDTGDEWALVDGGPVAPVAGLSAREAALQHVAGRVDAVSGRDPRGRPAPAVRVEASAPSGAILHLVVHRDGRVFVDRPTAPAPTPAGPSDEPWPDVDSGSWPRPTVEHARGPRGPAVLSEGGDTGPDFGDAWPDVAPAVGQTTRPAPPSLTPPNGPAPGNRLGDPTPSVSPARPATPPREPGHRMAPDPPPPPTSEGWKPGRFTQPGGPRPASDTAPGADHGVDEPGPGGATLIRPRRRLRLSPRVLVACLAGALLLTGLGVWGLSTLRGNTGVGVASGADAVFPGAAPDGWASQGRWVTPRLAPDSGTAVPLGDAVAFVTHERDLVVVDAATGNVRWSRPLADGPLVGGLHRTSIGGKDVLAVQTGTRLTWWPVEGGDGHRVDLPDNAKTSYYGPSPLIGVDARTAAVVLKGRLSRVPVPGGAYPLAARTDGTVTAASSQGWWHLTPGQAAPMVTPWEDPDPNGPARGAAPRLVGYTGGNLLALFPPDRRGQTFVVAYTDRSQSVLVNFRGRVAGDDPANAAWHPSPSGTWGILGNTLVDLDAGRVTDLGAGWQTRLVAEDRAIGLIGESPVVAGPAISRGVLRTGSAFPEGMTSQGALVRAEVDGGQVVYLLPPA